MTKEAQASCWRAMYTIYTNNNKNLNEKQNNEILKGMGKILGGKVQMAWTKWVIPGGLKEKDGMGIFKMGFY